MPLDAYEQQRAREAQAGKDKAILIAKRATFGVMAFIALTLAMCSFKTVEPGQRGVRVSLGTVEDKSLTPGLYWVNPFTTHITEMNVQTIKWEGNTQAYTKDVQTATVHFVANYNLKPEVAHVVYQTVGEDWANTLVGQVVTSQIKRVIGQYEAVELIAKRQDAQQTITSDITEQLAKKNVIVTGFQMTNVDYTPIFERAVEAKVVAQQDAIREQNHTAAVEQSAKQTVIRATAEAQSMQIRAHALESNPKLVEWEAVQKWKGEVPYIMGAGAVPFINMTPQGK